MLKYFALSQLETKYARILKKNPKTSSDIFSCKYTISY